MTFEETKALLLDLRAAKRRANVIRNRIADMESDYESIQSALGNDGMPHGNTASSRVEQLAIRVATEREKHMAALEIYFAIEDRLAFALEMLSPIEQDVIIGCYMDGKCNWQVGQDVNYSEVYVRKIKRRAIEKVAKIL